MVDETITMLQVLRLYIRFEYSTHTTRWFNMWL